MRLGWDHLRNECRQIREGFQDLSSDRQCSEVEEMRRDGKGH